MSDLSPRSKFDLSRAFVGADPAEHVIDSVMMVGAKYDRNLNLDMIDQGLLYVASSQLQEWKIPFSVAPGISIGATTRIDEPGIDIVNIMPEFGGQDFLSMPRAASMVMLCNIAKDGLYHMRDCMRHPHLLSILRQSFESSVDHDDTEKWATRLDETGANIVMVSGSDSFELAELNNGAFIELQTNDGLQGYLIRKEYLINAETYLMIQDSPLQNLPFYVREGACSFQRRQREFKPNF